MDFGGLVVRCVRNEYHQVCADTLRILDEGIAVRIHIRIRESVCARERERERESIE